MKSRPLMLCAILLVFLSCKKEDSYRRLSVQSAPREVVQGSGSTVQSPSGTITSLTDTLVPANAISVKKYGVIGDGSHDDTNAIQTALNSESVIYLPAGTYIINNTLNMRPGVKLYGGTGAIIKSGNNMRGTLSSRGMYFDITNANNSLINNIIFQQSNQAFQLGEWANSVICVVNSKSTIISNNTFDFNLPYATSGLEAVWVTGDNSENTVIKKNKLKSVGIEYAESGAKSTLVDGNYIVHAPSDGLSSHGNSLNYCSKNVVINNIIENSGLMGIEDFGKVDGTIISNNTITGVGKDPKQGNDGIGISAVGVNTRVTRNKISDAPIYYIESGGNNIIDSNIIKDTGGTAIGIIGNFTSTSIPNVPIIQSMAHMVGNTIIGCNKSIEILGDNLPNAEISANIIINPASIGINIDSNAPLYNINVANNNISFTIPNKRERKAFESYTALNHTGIQNVVLNNNTITYEPTATGGIGIEYGFKIGTDNVVINGNLINGNNIKGKKLPVYAISGNSDPAYNITLTSNTVNGAIVNLKDFTIKLTSTNNF